MIGDLATYASFLDRNDGCRIADAIDRVIFTAAAKKALQLDADEVGAIYAFMGWLTTRDGQAGPFSGRDNSDQAAELVASFCKTNGFNVWLEEPNIETWKSPDLS